MRHGRHISIAILLTILTQIGGVLWLISRLTRWPLFAFLALYTAITLTLPLAAPLTGRTPMPCFGETLSAQIPVYCILNRHYVTPELKEVAQDFAAHMADKFPGTQTRYLDGGLPFADGFPLIPHLSHDDGEKLDFALFWMDGEGRYLPGYSKSPVGYWGFHHGPTDCQSGFPTMRWDMGWIDTRLRDRIIEPQRMKTALRFLVDDPRVGKILLEPHLHPFQHPRLRFQGCHAARHDDHIHIQL